MLTRASVQALIAARMSFLLIKLSFITTSVWRLLSLLDRYFASPGGINLINNQDGTRVCVEHGKDLLCLNSVNIALVLKKLSQYFKDLVFVLGPRRKGFVCVELIR